MLAHCRRNFTVNDFPTVRHLFYYYLISWLTLKWNSLGPLINCYDYFNNNQDYNFYCLKLQHISKISIITLMPKQFSHISSLSFRFFHKQAHTKENRNNKNCIKMPLSFTHLEQIALTNLPGFRSFRPQVDPALNYTSIRPHLKLNIFELKYTSVYHFKMFLINFNFKNSNI